MYGSPNKVHTVRLIARDRVIDGVAVAVAARKFGVGAERVRGRMEEVGVWKDVVVVVLAIRKDVLCDSVLVEDIKCYTHLLVGFICAILNHGLFVSEYSNVFFNLSNTCSDTAFSELDSCACCSGKGNCSACRIFGNPFSSSLEL